MINNESLHSVVERSSKLSKYNLSSYLTLHIWASMDGVDGEQVSMAWRTSSRRDGSGHCSPGAVWSVTGPTHLKKSVFSDRTKQLQQHLD